MTSTAGSPAAEHQGERGRSPHETTIGLIAAERIRQAVAAVTVASCEAHTAPSSGPADGASPSSQGASVPGGLATCLAGVEAGLDGLERAGALDPALARDCLITAEFLMSRLHALRNGLVRAVHSQGESPAKGKRLVRGMLEDICHVSTTRSGQTVDNATLTDPTTGVLRELGAALAAGDVTGEHVEVARCGVGRISRQILHDHRARLDELITEHARNHPPEATGQLIAFLEHRLGVGRLGRAPEESRRFALMHAAGASFLSGQVDEATGRKLDALLDVLISRATIAGQVCAGTVGADTSGNAATRATDTRTTGPAGIHCDTDGPGGVTMGAGDAELGQEQISILDTRTRAQKRADAFTELVDLAGDHLALVLEPGTGDPVATGIGGQLNRKPMHSVARLVLHCHDDGPLAAPQRAPAAQPATECDPGCAGEQVSPAARWAGFSASTEDQSPLHAQLTDMQACDAVFDLARFDGRGRLISFTSVGRLASDRLTAAVIARDQCCSFPGCSRPPAMCQVHHVTWHRHGGPTSLDNLALVCGPHHRLIHTQPADPRDAWTMAMRDGLPHLRPPARLTPKHVPEAPWIRNTHPADLARARRIARQLDLDLDLDTS